MWRRSARSGFVCVVNNLTSDLQFNIEILWTSGLGYHVDLKVFSIDRAHMILINWFLLIIKENPYNSEIFRFFRKFSFLTSTNPVPVWACDLHISVCQAVTVFTMLPFSLVRFSSILVVYGLLQGSYATDANFNQTYSDIINTTVEAIYKFTYTEMRNRVSL